MIPYFTSHLVNPYTYDSKLSSDDESHTSVNWSTLDKEKRSLIKKGLL